MPKAVSVYQSPGGRERRLGTASEFVIHMLMPYGKWSLADGSEVLFNRCYEPIWRRTSGCITQADPTEWIKGITDQEWFYKDGSTYPAKRTSAAKVLRSWGLPDAIQLSAAAAWQERGV